MTLETTYFKFSPFLYLMKTCRWNLISFSKFTNGLIKKEKKTQWENEKPRKVGLCFIAGYFIKPFKWQLYRLFCLMIKEYIYLDECIQVTKQKLFHDGGTFTLVADADRSMLKTRITLGNISFVLLDLNKRSIFLMCKDSILQCSCS